MDSPVSAVVADMMEELERRSIQSLALQPCSRYYVDDTFVIWPNEAVSMMWQAVGETSPSINFTCELEQNGSLPLLDTIVTSGPDGILNIAVYINPLTLTVTSTSGHAIPFTANDEW